MSGDGHNYEALHGSQDEQAARTDIRWGIARCPG